MGTAACVRVCDCAEVTVLNPKSPLIRGLTEKTACHFLYTESLSFKLRDVCCKQISALSFQNRSMLQTQVKCFMCCNSSKCENSLFYAVSEILIHVIGLFLFLYNFPIYGFNEHYTTGNSDAIYVNLFNSF